MLKLLDSYGIKTAGIHQLMGLILPLSVQVHCFRVNNKKVFYENHSTKRVIISLNFSLSTNLQFTNSKYVSKQNNTQN